MQTTFDSTISGLLLYERKDWGIAIQYPPDWIIDEKPYNPYDDRFSQVVGFIIPSHDHLNQLREIASIEIRYLASHEIDFEAYTKRQIQNLGKRHADVFEFILLESSQATLAHRRVHKIDYIFTYKRNNPYSRSIELWTIEKGRAYHISYEAYSFEYLTFLPLLYNKCLARSKLPFSTIHPSLVKSKRITPTKSEVENISSRFTRNADRSLQITITRDLCKRLQIILTSLGKSRPFKWQKTLDMMLRNYIKYS
jgi:hypothetical protein